MPENSSEERQAAKHNEPPKTFFEVFAEPTEAEPAPTLSGESEPQPAASLWGESEPQAAASLWGEPQTPPATTRWGEPQVQPHAALNLVSPPKPDYEFSGSVSTDEFDPLRMGTIKFLAAEATETNQWKIIYAQKMRVHSITEQDVLDELKRSDERATKGIVTNTSKAWEKAAKTSLVKETSGDVVIYCWPYQAEAPTGAAHTWASTSTSVDPIVAVITAFGAMWLIASLILLTSTSHVHYFGGWTFLFKGIPLVLLPVMGLLKGLTHLRVAKQGLTFQSSSGKASLQAKTVRWGNIKRAHVSVPVNSANVLSGKLILDLYDGRKEIALRKIASSVQWRKLVQAMSSYIDVSELDPALLDGINQGMTQDPSYTKLWLDAMTAPPRRERLQPLFAGIELQKGQYKIEKLLGSGGQGSAYLASTSTTKVVLKEYILPVYVDVKVRRQALEDFEHESRILGSLDHKGIVKNLGSFIEDHRAYLVLEYVQGRSLRQIIDEQGALPEKDCARFGIEMCDILSYLHNQSPPVVHQDFTPDNLLVAPDGSLKLIDFMVAKQGAPDSSTGTVVGKHHYMPPEQFRGKATPRSDIYALGCSLYFMLTGCEPEPMSTSHPTLQNNHVSGLMNRIVEKATMLDQHQRYQETASLSQDLQQLVRESVSLNR